MDFIWYHRRQILQILYKQIIEKCRPPCSTTTSIRFHGIHSTTKTESVQLFDRAILFLIYTTTVLWCSVSYITLLSNWLPYLCHFSTLLDYWTTTVARICCCGIATVTLFAQHITWQRIHNTWDPAVCRSRLALVSTWNVDKYIIRASIHSDILIPSGHVIVAIVLNLLNTLLMRDSNLGDNLLDARESHTRSCLHLSAFDDRGSDSTIHSRTLTLDQIGNRGVSNCNIYEIYINLIENSNSP